mgnify:CR=1 FL=1
MERLITKNLLASSLKNMSFTIDTLRIPFASSLRGNIIYFVVPSELAPDYPKQKFQDKSGREMRTSKKKTKQWVLSMGLNQN